jgi:hypothetical protein
MAAYSSQVERRDRWKVIRYLRTLQDTPAATMAVAAAAEAEEGT